MSITAELAPAAEDAFNEAAAAERTVIQLVNQGADGDRVVDAEQYADRLWQLCDAITSS